MGRGLMFALKRPCANCPFRIGQGSLFRFHPDRFAEIIAAVAFQCHKTVDYEQWDDPELRSGDRPQQCAGLMAVLHRAGEMNQIMQVAERLGVLDLSALDPDGLAYRSIKEARAAHIDGKEPRWPASWQS